MRPKNREVYTWPNRSSGYISTRPFSSQDPPPLSPANSTSTPQSPDFSRLPGARSTTATSPITPTPRKAYTEKEVQDALSHCVSLTRKHDAANFAAALLMPRKVLMRYFVGLKFLKLCSTRFSLKNKLRILSSWEDSRGVGRYLK